MTVRDAIARERARVLRLTAVTAVGAALTVTVLLLAAGAALLGEARWLALPRATPFVLWGLALAANGAVVVAAWRRTRRSDAAAIAARIEDEQRLRAGVVRGALEVADSGALGRRAASVLAQELATRGPVLAPALRRRERRRAGLAVSLALAATLGLALAVAPFADGLRAMLAPASAYAGTLLPRLALRDAPDDVLRGEPVTIDVVAPGRSSVVVHYRTTGAAWQSRRVQVEDGVAAVSLGEMRGALQVVADDGRSRSDTASIAMADRPFIGGLGVRAAYPAYLQRAPEQLPTGGPMRVPRGTVLHIDGRASVALDRVALASGRDTAAFRPAAHAFSGRLTADASGTWSWIASAAGRHSVEVPEPLVLDVVPDSAPTVDLVYPTADTAVAPGQRVALRVGAADDHGLAAVQLEVRLERGGVAADPIRHTIASGPGTLWEGDAVVAGNAEPGDVLRVRAVATDRSPWAQRGASRELRIRILTSEERRDAARDAGDSAVAVAEAIARAQRSLAQRTDEAARARDRAAAAQGAQGQSAAARALSEEAGERARTIAREQRQLVERVEALQDAAKQLEQRLAQAGAMDSSLARQLREAQELMRQALSPELLAQMQRLEQAANALDGPQAQQALRDLATMQQRLREQLEQSAEMLKRAAHEGAMQTLADEARELAGRERQLADSAARGKADAAQQAEKLADRSERYADDVRRLQERLARDRATAASQGTSEAQQAARRAEDRLREGAAAGQSAGNQAGRQRSGEQQAGQQQAGQQQAGQQVAQGAQQAAGEMDRAADAMEAARDAQVNEWKRELTQELDRAVQEMLQMAREERTLEQQARDGRQGAAQLRGRQGSVQQGVDQTRQRLQEAGKRSALLSGGSQRAVAEAREKVQAATRELSQAQGGNASPQAATALADAADALNRAAASLARDRQRAGSASSASGFSEMMQQLQQMAQRQGSVNAQAQGLLQMPGGQQSAQGAQMARALARQQRQIAQGLDDIGEEAGGGRTGELAREARALAEALEAGRLDARTTARQEQLFKRLLDAGRALEKEEREDSERREARAATGTETHTPAGGPASGRDARRYREPTWEELRGLSAEERRAILEYFRKINAGTP